MAEKVDIYNLASYGLKLAQNKSLNVKCAEIFFDQNKYINIEVEENSVKNSEIGSDHGVSIRVIDKRGSLGFAFTNKLEKKSIDKIIDIAVKMMKVGTEDSDFIDLPNPYKKYPHIKGLFDIKRNSIQEKDKNNVHFMI